MPFIARFFDNNENESISLNIPTLYTYTNIHQYMHPKLIICGAKFIK